MDILTVVKRVHTVCQLLPIDENYETQGVISFSEFVSLGLFIRTNG
jgi:hypothetical protein